MNYITTRSGKKVSIESPDKKTIELNDIAFSLARVRRFNGHTQANCSVALHSCMVAQYLLRFGHAALARWGLMHDAEEAYTGDIVTPLKELLDLKVTNELKYTIMQRFKIRTKTGNSWVKYFDLVSMKYEKEMYLNSCEDWSILADIPLIEPDTGSEFYSDQNPYTHEKLFLEYAKLLGIS